METTAGPAWIVTAGEPDPATVERLLRSLPEWFGIESAVAEYVETARHRPAYLAWPSVSTAGQTERRPVGVLLATRHFRAQPRSTCWPLTAACTGAASAAPLSRPWWPT